MKKRIKSVLPFVVCMLLAGKLLGQENHKAEKAREEIQDGNTKLIEAKQDSISDYDHYKKDALKKIAENQAKIVDLKIKKAIKTEEIQAEFDKKVLALELKNSELQNRLNGCTYDDPTLWATFKNRFTKELDDIENAIKNMTVVLDNQ